MNLTLREERLKKNIVNKINNIMIDNFNELSTLDRAYVIDCITFESDDNDDRQMNTSLDIKSIAKSINKDIQDIFESKCKYVGHNPRMDKFKGFMELELYNFFLSEIKLCYAEAFKEDKNTIVRSDLALWLLDPKL